MFEIMNGFINLLMTARQYANPFAHIQPALFNYQVFPAVAEIVNKFL